MKTAFIVVLCLATALAGVPKGHPVHPVFAPATPNSKIVGGTEVTPHSVPYQVGLFLSGGYFCGASLISTEWVLTAAHCGELDRSPEVVLGAHKIRDTSESTQRRVTGTTTVHENWDSANLVNDIAIIRISRVSLTNAIQTVAIPSRTAGTFAGLTATATGWGKDSDSAGGISAVLRKTSNPILTNSVCDSEFGFGIDIGNGLICMSGSGGHSTCNGDSGGPLVVTQNGRLVEVGLTSFGISLGCAVGYPAAFTRISYYADWINRISGVTGFSE